jgi:hypothetical protein
VWIELIDEKQEAVMVWCVLVEPAYRGRHGARAGKVGLATKVAARVVVGHPAALERRGAEPARVGPRLPRIALVSALVVPGGEVAVVVLAADLEQVRVIGNQRRRHAGAPQRHGNGLFPQLDRSPRLPQEVERAAQNVVPRRHARQGAGIVPFETQRALREAVEVGRGELRPAVRTEHVAVQAIEEDDDGVARRRRRLRCGVHGCTLWRKRVREGKGVPFARIKPALPLGTDCTQNLGRRLSPSCGTVEVSVETHQDQLVLRGRRVLVGIVKVQTELPSHTPQLRHVTRLKVNQNQFGRRRECPVQTGGGPPFG